MRALPQGLRTAFGGPDTTAWDEFVPKDFATKNSHADDIAPATRVMALPARAAGRGSCARWRWCCWRRAWAPAAASICSARTTRRPTSRRQALQRGRLPAQRQARLQGGGEEIRGGRPPAPLFGMGAQGADHDGLCLLPGRRLRRVRHRGPALRHAASRQPGRRLRAVPDRRRPISTRSRTSPATRRAPRRRSPRSRK